MIDGSVDLKCSELIESFSADSVQVFELLFVVVSNAFRVNGPNRAVFKITSSTCVRVLTR